MFLKCSKSLLQEQQKSAFQILEEIFLRPLTPEIAEELSTFPLSELFLNNIYVLEPKVANHLKSFQGKTIQLNGLEDFSTETSMELSGWNGESLELKGLKVYPSHPWNL